jgi:hypothetical protein
MKTWVMIVGVMLLLSGLPGCAGTGQKEGTALQPPKPPAELKALEVFQGTWKHEEEVQTTPLWPAGKYIYTHTGRWILDGFFLEVQVETEKNGHWLEIDWYDPTAKGFRSWEFDDTGFIWSGSMAVNGNRWTNSSTMTVKGVEYKVKFSGNVSDDKKTYTYKGDLSADGKTWKPLLEGKATKISDSSAFQPNLQASNPQAELKPLEVFLGTWKNEDQIQATPLGPAGKYPATQTNRWILDGFFSESTIVTEKNEHWLIIGWYDPAAKCFRSQEFDDTGVTWSGSAIVDGNRWTSSWTTTINKVDYQFKYSTIVSDDKKTVTGKADYSVDGKTWKPFSEGKGIKIAEP